MSECLTCGLIARRDAGEAPPWDCIYRTDFFDVAHANNSFLPGWIVVVARRHVESIADLDEDAAIELGSLIHRVSAALHEVTGCVKTYVMQFAEAEGHGHVHFHIVPRMAYIPERHRGANVFAYLGADDDSRVPEARMNEIAEEVKRRIARV